MERGLMLVAGTFLGSNTAIMNMSVVVYGRMHLYLCNRILSIFAGLQDMGIASDPVAQTQYGGIFFQFNYTR